MMALSAYDSSVEQKMCLDNNNFVHFGTKKIEMKKVKQPKFLT